MSNKKQECKRLNCKHLEKGFCKLVKPKTWKREALLDCIDFKNKS